VTGDRARVGPAANSATRAIGTLGELVAIPGRPGVVVGVPHGTFDEGTDEIGKGASALTGAGTVIATGFCGRRTGGVRLNVNRPTEGVGRDEGGERPTARARAVHAGYVERVRLLASGGLRVYCEVHGNRQPATAERIEIATAGVDAAVARRIREMARVPLAALGARCGAGLALAIEPDDRLYFTASSARRWPPFAEAGRVLHVELPRAARRPEARGLAAAFVAALVAAAEGGG
jgi:hypothetical protein